MADGIATLILAALCTEWPVETKPTLYTRSRQVNTVRQSLHCALNISHVHQCLCFQAARCPNSLGHLLPPPLPLSGRWSPVRRKSGAAPTHIRCTMVATTPPFHLWLFRPPGAVHPFNMLVPRDSAYLPSSSRSSPRRPLARGAVLQIPQWCSASPSRCHVLVSFLTRSPTSGAGGTIVHLTWYRHDSLQYLEEGGAATGGWRFKVWLVRMREPPRHITPLTLPLGRVCNYSCPRPIGIPTSLVL